MHSIGVQWELPAGARLENAPSVIPNQVALSAFESGPGLVRMLTKAVISQGTQILYETKMLSVVLGERGEITGITIQDQDGVHTIFCMAVVLACGGFEAAQGRL